MNKIDEVMHAFGDHSWSDLIDFQANHYRVCKVCKRIEYWDKSYPARWYESQFNDLECRKTESIHWTKLWWAVRRGTEIVL